jgi:hypothetical protein
VYSIYLLYIPVNQTYFHYLVTKLGAPFAIFHLHFGYFIVLCSMLFAIFSREIFLIQVEFDVQNLYVICNLRSRLNYVILEILLGIAEYWISAK